LSISELALIAITVWTVFLAVSFGHSMNNLSGVLPAVWQQQVDDGGDFCLWKSILYRFCIVGDLSLRIFFKL
jgi:hypothetical protein